MSSLTKQLDRLELSRLIALKQSWPDREYQFRHTLVQDAAYGTLLKGERRQIHLATAEALERLYDEGLDELAPVLGRHFAEAEEYERAYRYFVRAANQAASVHAHQEAETHFHDAIKLAQQMDKTDEEVMGLLLARGRMMEHSGRFEEALDLYREMETVAEAKNNNLMVCAAISRQAFCYIKPTSVHNHTLAEPLLRKGLALAKEVDNPELEADLLWGYMVRETHYGNSEKAKEVGQRCLAIARQHKLTSQLARVLHDLALNLRLTGDLELGEAYASESRKLFRDAGNLSMLVDSLNQQGLMDILHLDLNSSMIHTTEAYDISHRIDNGWNLAYARWQQGMVAYYRGEWGLAQTLMRESITRGESVGFLMSLITVRLQLGNLLGQLGQGQSAVDLHHQAHKAAEEHGPFMLRAVEAHLAVDAFINQDPELGMKWLEKAEDRQSLGEIATALELRSIAQAAVHRASYDGHWQVALDIVEETLAEAQHRRLDLHELYLKVDRSQCLIGMARLNEAESELLRTNGYVEKATIMPLEWHIYSLLMDINKATGRESAVEKYKLKASEIVLKLISSLMDPEQKQQFRSTPVVESLD
jgi:tetratricopeptide (TPR) repeat protein